jgi:hypothetical protein
MRVSPAVNVLVTTVVIYSLAGAVRRGRREAWTAARHIRPKDILGTFLVLPVVMLTGAALSRLPVLDWGWWSALGGTGSVVFSGASSGRGATLLLLLLIAVAVPELALREEEAFRRGSERRDRTANAGWALLFGLVHAFMGIPIGYAIALSFVGAYFTYRYLRAYRRAGRAVAHRVALAASTTAHIAWNWTLLLFVLVTTLTRTAN